MAQSKTPKKPRAVGTTIGSKDQKILWSRAAGLCSMPECRAKLTLNTSNNTTVTLGQMCHIVGEKKSKANARGMSSMLIKERNKYSNLILLCNYHHDIIDKDEKKYTIEYLHFLKDEHELWVEETLSQRTIKPDELVYSSLIDLLSISLQLEKWNWFISNAVRQLVHRDFIDAYNTVIERQLAVVFPETKPELETAIKNLMQSYTDYIDQYLSFATMPHDWDFYRPDNFYKQNFPNPHYGYYSDKHNLWARKNFTMLCLYVVRVNEFAEVVRKFSNPLFFVVRGKFLVIDELGTHLGDWGSLMNPSYDNTVERLNAINKEIEVFDETHKDPQLK